MHSLLFSFLCGWNENYARAIWSSDISVPNLLDFIQASEAGGWNQG